MITVIDNFVPIRYQDELESVFCSDSFLWTYQGCTYKPYDGVDDRIQDVPFLGRKVYGGSTHIPEFDVVRPLIYFFMEHTGLEVMDLARVKANKMFINTDRRWHPPHTDIDLPNFHTLLYYVNSNDGDTLLFEDQTYKLCKRITPKKGRAVVFPSNQLHCGTSPTTAMKVALNCIISTK